MLNEKLNVFLNFACLVPLFKGLDSNELEILYQTFDYHTFTKGSVVVAEDKKNESKFYIILSGRVKVSTISDEGNEKVFSILEVGNSFGEMALLEKQPRSASVIAMSDCELYSLDSIAFFRMLDIFPQVAIALLKNLSSRLRVLNQLNVNIAFLTTPQRIRNYLINLAALRGKRNGDGYLEIANMPSQLTIAHYLNCSRESVSREVKRLCAQKYIEKKKTRRLVIINEKVLQS